MINFELIGEASQPEFFDDASNCKEIAAAALRQGCLRLVLGAGVSAALGLPNWGELLGRMSLRHGPAPEGLDLSEQSDWYLRNRFSTDREKFANAVRELLYDGYDGTMIGMATHPLMVSLGALSMAGLRGGVSEIVTFNFDDLLERYLRFHGFHVRVTASLPSVSKKNDVEVLHIHGVLPFDLTASIPRNIVFTESDFDEVVGDVTQLWSQRVSHILRSNFCIFIGLSGKDPNLRSILKAVNKNHSLNNVSASWGLRFNSNADDAKREMFEENGVKQITVPNNDIAEWLLKVTELAATQS